MAFMMIPNASPAATAALITSLYSERAALVSAIASGAKSAAYDGKSVTYDDLSGMKQRLNFIDGQVAMLTGTSALSRKPQAGFAQFGRGYNTRRGFGYGGFYGMG
jgi:hypothetical protein